MFAMHVNYPEHVQGYRYAQLHLNYCDNELANLSVNRLLTLLNQNICQFQFDYLILISNLKGTNIHLSIYF